MEDFTAVQIAEGLVSTATKEQIQEAWQHLHDTGLAYKLQGWFGRTATELVKRGIITK